MDIYFLDIPLFIIMKLKTLLELSNNEIKYWALFANIYDQHFKKLTSRKELEKKFQALKFMFTGEKRNAFNYFYNYSKVHLAEGILVEGRYDKISGNIMDEILSFLKKSKQIFDKDNNKQIQTLIKKYSYPLIFTFKLTIGRAYDIEDPELSAQILTKTNNVNYLEAVILINPKDEPTKYNWISGKIKGLIRHELEHATQEGINRIKDRPSLTDEEQELYSKALENGDFISYFTNKMEVPAHVKQMYTVAKFYKVSIDVAIDDFLGEAVKAEYISEEEKIIITNNWISYIKKNLPAAQFQK